MGGSNSVLIRLRHDPGRLVKELAEAGVLIVVGIS
jgi:hypothetical protein